LDAGCGPGYGLEYLKSLMPDVTLFGIEASPDARYVLEKNVGATILDSDLDGDWHINSEGQFDVIILRHVVEHILDPVKTLSNLKKTLSAEGFMYIAVPDMMHPRTILRDYTDWWEYWFRNVHAYYYCKETLFGTLFMAGLEAISFKEENEEVWCIVKEIDYRKHNKANVEEVDVYEQQIEVLGVHLP
jgi:SAM-dependent methyltransferase